MITNIDLADATGIASIAAFEVDGLDLVGGDSAPRILTFIDDGHFVNEALENPRLRVILANSDISQKLAGSNATVVLVDDPRWHYYTLHNYLTAKRRDETPSIIAHSAIVDPSAYISSTGVVIEAGAVIEANATVLSSSTIKRDAIIRAGAVIGTTGFEHKRTTRGILSVVHDGTVTIGERSEIGALSVVAQGFARRHTVVGSDVKVDCNVMIAHGNHIGNRVFIAAGATLSGSTTIGDEVWIGPGAVLRDQITVGTGARIGLGSVVLRDVEPGNKVFGNPARVHA